MTPLAATSRASVQTATLPYRMRDHFLTPDEVSLYSDLKALVQDRYVVFPKVALNDIFLIVRPNENVHYFNKLFRKHVDFLLCSPASLGPRMGLELIRGSAKGGEREVDQFMRELFISAGLPLVQIPSGERPELSELSRLFQEAFAKVKESQVHGPPPEDSIPTCPVCGKMMVLRTQRGGKAEGRLYYGCVDNPTCPGRVAIK